jgi:hypothetical protein
MQRWKALSSVMSRHQRYGGPWRIEGEIYFPTRTTCHLSRTTVSIGSLETPVSVPAVLYPDVTRSRSYSSTMTTSQKTVYVKVVSVIYWLRTNQWRRGCIAPLFLTWALDRGKWSASRLGRFNPGKQLPVPIVEKAVWFPEHVWMQWREVPCPCRE